MSVEAMEAAIASPAPSHTAKLVMMVLAYHHHSVTGLCFPSQERIAAECSLAKSSVVRALKELEEHSLITKRKGRRAGRKNAPNFYKLIFLTQATLLEKQRHRGYTRDGSAALPDKEPPTSPLRSEVGTPPKRKKRSQKRAPKLRIEPTWQPSAALRKSSIEKMAEHGIPEQQLERYILDFRDYYGGRGEVSAAWGLDFSRWVRKQIDFKEADDARQAARDARLGTGPGGRGDQRQDALRRLHASTDPGGGGGGEPD